MHWTKLPAGDDYRMTKSTRRRRIRFGESARVVKSLHKDKMMADRACTQGEKANTDRRGRLTEFCVLEGSQKRLAEFEGNDD